MGRSSDLANDECRLPGVAGATAGSEPYWSACCCCLRRMQVLRGTRPPQGWLEQYERDGYFVVEDAMTVEGREALVREVITDPRSAAMLQQVLPEKDRQMTVRPWDTMCEDPKTAQDALLDAPLVRAMLSEVMGPQYTFCHSGFSIRTPGASSTPMHQDFAYGPAPYASPGHSPASDLAVVQILYYPTGFKQGDAHLRVIPGSNKISAFDPRLEGPELKRGSHFEAVLHQEFGLAPLELGLQPGSFVFLNGRCFHGVSEKPDASPEQARLFVFYVFKNGPQHRHTQPVPSVRLLHFLNVYLSLGLAHDCWFRRDGSRTAWVLVQSTGACSWIAKRTGQSKVCRGRGMIHGTPSIAASAKMPRRGCEWVARMIVIVINQTSRP